MSASVSISSSLDDGNKKIINPANPPPHVTSICDSDDNLSPGTPDVVVVCSMDKIVPDNNINIIKNNFNDVDDIPPPPEMTQVSTSTNINLDKNNNGGHEIRGERIRFNSRDDVIEQTPDVLQQLQQQQENVAVDTVGMIPDKAVVMTMAPDIIDTKQNPKKINPCSIDNEQKQQAQQPLEIKSSSKNNIITTTLKNEQEKDSKDDSIENFISNPLEGPSRCEIVNPETFLVDVIVTNAVSPLNFSIQSYRESNILKNLEDQMTSWYNTYENQILDPHPSLQFKDLILDAYYALKYTTDKKLSKSERWVRCQIKKPFGESLPILTHLIDHGCYYSTEPKCIRPLRKQYCKIPCQSFDAKLHFVESTKSSFTPEDCHRFHNQVEGKAFCAIVLKNLPTNQDKKLTVILVDTSTEKDQYIHHDYVCPKKSNGWK